MTMPHPVHPDDEQLAALASGDREAVSDRVLTLHVGSCERCRPLVDELAVLRDALAVLPDIAPSRPLRLIPPVAEPVAPRGGALEWVRRLAAPAMAAGAGLVLVGAVGATGLVGGLGWKAADTTSVQESSTGGVAAPEGAGKASRAPAIGTDSEGFFRTNDPRSRASAVPAPSTAAPSAAEDLAAGGHGPAEQPWLTLLIAGFGLFGISAVLRHSLAPRAG